jgi:surface polysaccharide O-acyltransferase-like enzyme
VGTGIVAFLVRLGYPAGKNFFGLQFGYFPLYIAMYIVGIVAARRHWTEKLTLRQSKPWFYLSIAAILVLMIVMMQNAGNDLSSFSGGWNTSALFYAMWEPVVCVGFCFFITLLARDHMNRPDNFVTKMSKASYPAYIIHPLIVVLSTFVLESLHVSPYLKIAGVCLLAVPVCFGAGVLFNRITKK